MESCTCNRAKLAGNEHYVGCAYMRSYLTAHVHKDPVTGPPAPPLPRVPYARPKNLPKPTVRPARAAPAPNRTA